MSVLADTTMMMEADGKCGSQGPRMKQPCRDDGDQSPVTEEEVIEQLESQYAKFMKVAMFPFKYSRWVQAMYRGDYNVMVILSKLSKEETEKKLEVREISCNRSVVFHVIMVSLLFYSDAPSILKVKKMVQRYMNVKYDHMRILKKLIELGANINARDVVGKNSLHYCIFGNSVNKTLWAMAEIMLKAGADPNHRNRFGKSPLYDCVRVGDIESITLLLKYGANPHLMEYVDSMECFTAACLRGFPHVEKMLADVEKEAAMKERAVQKKAAGGSFSKCCVCGKEGTLCLG